MRSLSCLPNLSSLQILTKLIPGPSYDDGLSQYLQDTDFVGHMGQPPMLQAIYEWQTSGDYWIWNWCDSQWRARMVSKWNYWELINGEVWFMHCTSSKRKNCILLVKKRRRREDYLSKSYSLHWQACRPYLEYVWYPMHYSRWQDLLIQVPKHDGGHYGRHSPKRSLSGEHSDIIQFLFTKRRVREFEITKAFMHNIQAGIAFRGMRRPVGEVMTSEVQVLVWWLRDQPQSTPHIDSIHPFPKKIISYTHLINLDNLPLFLLRLRLFLPRS